MNEQVFIPRVGILRRSLNEEYFSKGSYFHPISCLTLVCISFCLNNFSKWQFFNLHPEDTTAIVRPMIARVDIWAEKTELSTTARKLQKLQRLLGITPPHPHIQMQTSREVAANFRMVGIINEERCCPKSKENRHSSSVVPRFTNIKR